MHEHRGPLFFLFDKYDDTEMRQRNHNYKWHCWVGKFRNSFKKIPDVLNNTQGLKRKKFAKVKPNFNIGRPVTLQRPLVQPLWKLLVYFNNTSYKKGPFCLLVPDKTIMMHAWPNILSHGVTLYFRLKGKENLRLVLVIILILSFFKKN